MRKDLQQDLDDASRELRQAVAAGEVVLTTTPHRKRVVTTSLPKWFRIDVVCCVALVLTVAAGSWQFVDTRQRASENHTRIALIRTGEAKACAAGVANREIASTNRENVRTLATAALVVVEDTLRADRSRGNTVAVEHDRQFIRAFERMVASPRVPRFVCPYRT